MTECKPHYHLILFLVQEREEHAWEARVTVGHDAFHTVSVFHPLVAQSKGNLAHLDISAVKQKTRHGDERMREINPRQHCCLTIGR